MASASFSFTLITCRARPFSAQAKYLYACKYLLPTAFLHFLFQLQLPSLVLRPPLSSIAETSLEKSTRSAALTMSFLQKEKKNMKKIHIKQRLSMKYTKRKKKMMMKRKNLHSVLVIILSADA